MLYIPNGRNKALSLVLIVLLMLCCIFILGKHIPEYAHLFSGNPKVKALRRINWFSIVIV